MYVYLYIYIYIPYCPMYKHYTTIDLNGYSIYNWVTSIISQLAKHRHEVIGKPFNFRIKF